MTVIIAVGLKKAELQVKRVFVVAACSTLFFEPRAFASPFEHSAREL